MTTPTSPSRRAASTAAGRVETAAFVLLAAAVAMAPNLYGAIDPPSLLLLRVSVLSAATLQLLSVSMGRRATLPPAYLALPLLVYLALVLVAALRSSYAFGAAQGALDATIPVISFFAVAGAATSERRRRLLWIALLAGAAATAGAGLLQAAGSALVPVPSEARISGFFANPNHFAGVLDLAAPLALAGTLFGRTWPWRAACGMLAAAFYLAAGLTFSYGGWLSAGIGLMLLLSMWAWRGWRRRRSGWPTVGAAVVATCALLVGAAFIAGSPRLDGRPAERIRELSDVANLGSLRSRLEIQRKTLALVRDHPWTGVGPVGFDDAILRYRPERIERRGQVFLHRTLTHAMSDYLNVAVAGGLLALAAFVTFWVLALVRAPPSAPDVRLGAVAALAAILVHGLVDGNLTYVTGNAFLAFAVAGLLHAPRHEHRPHGGSRLH